MRLIFSCLEQPHCICFFNSEVESLLKLFIRVVVAFSSSYHDTKSPLMCFRKTMGDKTKTLALERSGNENTSAATKVST